MLDVAKSSEKSPALSVSYLRSKRALDILLCGAGIILLSPLLILIACAVKFSSRGPILFKQPRAGKDGKPFHCLKFRSMTADAEQRRHEIAHLNEVDGPMFKVKNDPRITPIGAKLRKYSLDELPQLFNVLRGEMTLVGPRPSLAGEIERFEPWMLRRLEVTPGITCIWQISGRSNISFEEWMRMDIEYIDKCSLALDASILIRTIPAVLFAKGAY